MKTSNVQTSHPFAIIAGWVDTTLGSDNPSTVVNPDIENASGAALIAGDVVVVNSAGQITTTTTAGYIGIVGVVLDDIAAGDFGPVAFAGPVDLVNVTAAVTAGNYGETSTTAKKAQDAGASQVAGAFVLFTSSGTTPSGILLSSSGGGDFVLTYTGGEERVAALGNLGATETIDLINGNWQRGTLNANCTISFTGATNGKGCSFTLFLTEDGTGGYSPTWPGSVVWIGGTVPVHDTTAGSISIYIFLSYDGGTTWFGALAGGGTSSSSSITGNHQHTVGDAFNADGTSQTYYLSNWPDNDTVAAYQAGLRVDVTQSGDAVTFAGIPPINAALRFDYILELT